MEKPRKGRNLENLFWGKPKKSRISDQPSQVMSGRSTWPPTKRQLWGIWCEVVDDGNNSLFLADFPTFWKVTVGLSGKRQSRHLAKNTFACLYRLRALFGCVVNVHDAQRLHVTHTRISRIILSQQTDPVQPVVAAPMRCRFQKVSAGNRC